MPTQPELTTERLLLRLPREEDAERIAELLGEREVAATTLNIPNPYSLDDAAEWIGKCRAEVEAGKCFSAVICVREDGDGDQAASQSSHLIGSIGLHYDQRHNHGEIGYWIGKPYWGKGYASEAARAVIRHGFETAGLHKIYAHHMVHNPASGRILEKLGMQREGMLRSHIRKWDDYVDITLYGMLDTDYAALRGQQLQTPPGAGGC